MYGCECVFSIVWERSQRESTKLIVLHGRRHNEIYVLLVIGRQRLGPDHMGKFFGPGENGLWCKSKRYCYHISQPLVKTTLRILGQQIRPRKYEFLLCG